MRNEKLVLFSQRSYNINPQLTCCTGQRHPSSMLVLHPEIRSPKDIYHLPKTPKNNNKKYNTHT